MKQERSVFMITKKVIKERYKEMEALESDKAYQDLLRRSYRIYTKNHNSTVAVFVCLVIALLLTILLIRLLGRPLTAEKGLIMALPAISYTIFVMFNITMEDCINNSSIKYLNDIAHKHYKFIEDDAYLIQYGACDFRIVKNGEIIPNKKFYPIYYAISDMELKTIEYLTIDKNGYIIPTKDYILIHDGIAQ